jgi:hypothetical protein
MWRNAGQKKGAREDLVWWNADKGTVSRGVNQCCRRSLGGRTMRNDRHKKIMM